MRVTEVWGLWSSGGITEDSSILGFPAITVRQAHERPEGMDEGCLIMSGLDLQRILDSIELATLQFKEFVPSKLIDDYNVDRCRGKSPRSFSATWIS